MRSKNRTGSQAVSRPVVRLSRTENETVAYRHPSFPHPVVFSEVGHTVLSEEEKDAIRWFVQATSHRFSIIESAVPEILHAYRSHPDVREADLRRRIAAARRVVEGLEEELREQGQNTAQGEDPKNAGNQ